MPKDSRTAAQRNRAIRQEALREQLSQQKHVEQVVENIEKIEDVEGFIKKKINEGLKIEQIIPLVKSNTERLKTATELRLKLVNKYLPDLKASEVEIFGGLEESPNIPDETKGKVIKLLDGKC